MEIEKFIKQYWNCVASQQEELESYFHEDACIRWPNTKEQFRVKEYIRANCDYPGNWYCEVKRIEQSGNTVITVARVWSKEISFHVTSFIEMIDEKIKHLEEYWGEDGEAPQWRQDIISRFHELKE